MPTDHSHPPNALFPPTAWSRIQAGSGQSGAAEVREALDEICKRYWGPARKFLRSLGCGAEDAEDLTQEFFSKWAQPEKLAGLDPEKGRLRSYLKQGLRRHFINHWRAGQTEKRGGGVGEASIDDLGEIGDEDSGADLEYDIAWAEAVLSAVVGRLGAAYAGRGRGELFEMLADGLPGGNGLKPYAEIAVSAGMKDAQIKIEVHRLRRRFADELRAEVAGTLASADELDDELRHLVRVMTRVHGDPS